MESKLATHQHEVNSYNSFWQGLAHDRFVDRYKNEKAPRYQAVIQCFSEQIEDMKHILREKIENDKRMAANLHAGNIAMGGSSVEPTPTQPMPATPSPALTPSPTAAPSPTPLTPSPTSPPSSPTLSPTPSPTSPPLTPTAPPPSDPTSQGGGEHQQMRGRGQPSNSIGRVAPAGSRGNSAAGGAAGAASGVAGAAAIGAMPFNHDLFDDEAIRDIVENGSRNGTARIDGPVELLTNAEAGVAGVGAGIFQVVDLITMSEYRIYIGFAPGNAHSDFTPMSPTDTATMLANAGGSWNWLPRPMVLKVGSRMLACGIHSFPHGSIMGSASPGLGLSNQSNTKPAGGWPIGGHMCMYFKNSTGGTLGIREAAHAAYRIGNEIFKRQSTESCAEAMID